MAETTTFPDKKTTGWSGIMRYSGLMLALGVFLAGSATAQSFSTPQSGRFKGALIFGYDATISGDFHGAATGDFAGLPATITKGGFSDIYDAPFRYGAELSYGTSNFSEFFARLSYARASGKTATVGTAASAFPIQATFGDYQEYDVSAGYRQYIRMDGTPLTPYIAGSLGMKRVDEIRAELSVPDASIALTDAKFYDASWVPTMGVDVGLLYPISGSFALGIEGGVHYQFALSGNDDTLSNPVVGSGLDKLNDEGAKWSFPMAVKGIVKF